MADDWPKKQGETTDPNMDSASFWRNFYITPKHKKISDELKKIDGYNAKAYKAGKNVINNVKGAYTVEYVQRVILIAKNNRNLISQLELSEEKERDTLEAITGLKDIDAGIEQEKLVKLLHVIEYISDLEECLFRKGLLSKEPLSLHLTNKISKEGGEKE